MKTANLKYKNIENLKYYINQNQFINSKSLLIQIFSGSLKKKKLEEITKLIYTALPHSNIIGATSDGEIFEDNVSTNSIIISFTSFEQTKISISCIKNISNKNSYNVGKKLCQNIIQEDSKAIILFADGLNTNGDEFLNGVKNKSNNVIVSGGLAADNARFKRTYIIYNDKVLTNSVVGVSLNSEVLNVYNDYSLSWESIGKEFTVNKSDENIVYEIDGMTPFKLYEKYLGKEISHSIAQIGIEFPLIIQNDDLKIARVPLETYDDGSFKFAANISQNSKVKFSIASIESLLNDSKKLAYKLSTVNTQSIFVYSCMARHKFLKDEVSKDIVQLSKLSNVSGLFTYGEFYTCNNNLHLLNSSMTILSLNESNEKVNNSLLIDDDFKNKNLNTVSALSNLVKVANEELCLLNKSLEEKIIKEVEKNEITKEQLYENVKMASLGDMISNIAHQWRQPLSIITTCASAMQLHKELNILNDEMFLNYTETIVSQGQYLSDTINIFREYIQDTHILSDIIIQNEIKTTLKLLSSVIKDSNIKLTQNINYKTSVMLKLISGELPQVIINVINNAKDALMSKNIQNKEIIISLEIEKTKCIISIEDNAGGIPLDVINNIFEPYYTTKSKDIGTGIGLYMSYEIVTKHLNGDMYVKNTDKGAMFSIELPRNLD